MSFVTLVLAWIKKGAADAQQKLPPSQPELSPAEERFEKESAGSVAPPPMLRHTWRW